MTNAPPPVCAASAGVARISAGPVELSVAFHFARPSSRVRKANRNDCTPRDRKPDLPNLIAAVCDALIGIGYADDRQVVRIRAGKYESAGPPRTEITVKALEVKP